MGGWVDCLVTRRKCTRHSTTHPPTHPPTHLLTGIFAAFHTFVQASEVLLEEGEGEEVGQEGWIETEAVEESERGAARGGRGRQAVAVQLGEGRQRGRLHGLLGLLVVAKAVWWVGGWVGMSVFFFEGRVSLKWFQGQERDVAPHVKTRSIHSASSWLVKRKGNFRQLRH